MMSLSSDKAHEERLQRLRETEIFAVSSSACFYPEHDNPEEFDGSTITWTFELPRSSRDIGSGVYRVQFVRTLAEEEALGNPVLASVDRSPEGEDRETGLHAKHESAVGDSRDAQEHSS